MEKVKKLNILYKIFLILGVVGILNILTVGIIKENYGLTDMGGISYFLMYIFNFLLGSSVAAGVGVLLNLVLSFAIVWLIFAWIIKARMDKLKNISL